MTATDFERMYAAPSTRKEATISENGLYRYRLYRRWILGAAPARVCTFVMVNPSTADGVVDDPTIRRCLRFAHAAGCNALKVVNLYAYRTPSVVKLQQVATEHGTAYPVGEHNAAHVRLAIQLAGTAGWPLVVAWGAAVDKVSTGADRVAWIARELIYQSVEAQCLGLTKEGHPRHPLYVRADADLRPWGPTEQ